MKKFEILKTIDEASLKKLDEVQDTALKKVMDAYGSAEEKYQELVKAGLAVLLVALPVLIIGLFAMSNSGLKDELQLKEEIIQMASSYIEDHGRIRTAEKKILGNNLVTDQGQLQNKITAAVNSAGVDSTKMQISNFDMLELDGNIVQTKIDVKFSELSNDHLFNLLAGLINKERIKVETLTVNKNQANNLLDGLMVLYYFSKESEE